MPRGNPWLCKLNQNLCVYATSGKGSAPRVRCMSRILRQGGAAVLDIMSLTWSVHPVSTLYPTPTAAAILISLQKHSKSA